MYTNCDRQEVMNALLRSMCASPAYHCQAGLPGTADIQSDKHPLSEWLPNEGFQARLRVVVCGGQACSSLGSIGGEANWVLGVNIYCGVGVFLIHVSIKIVVAGGRGQRYSTRRYTLTPYHNSSQVAR